MMTKLKVGKSSIELLARILYTPEQAASALEHLKNLAGISNIYI